MRRRDKNRFFLLRLDEWGEWAIKPVIGIGYNDRTIEYVMMEMGGIYSDGTHQSRVPNYKPNPRCAEVERMISELPRKHNAAIWARHALVLKDHEIEQACGFSARQCYRYLESIYPEIASKLGYAYER